YRLTAEGRPLVTPVTQHGKTVPELLQQLREYEVATRYRLHRELRDRPKDEGLAAAPSLARTLHLAPPEYERMMTELMWVFAGQQVAHESLMSQLLEAKNPNARAASVHLIADMRDQIPQAFELLAHMVNDAHPRVRLEAVRGLSYFATI